MHKSGSDGKFTSSIGFVLAAVGSAVGMANICSFPTGWGSTAAAPS